MGLFETKKDAERALMRLQQDLNIAGSDISYVYRDVTEEEKDTERKESVSDMSTSATSEGAMSGMLVGGAMGAIAGLATVGGLLPVIGPIFAAGPIITALGIGGAAGTVAAGAATGAATGELIGALMNLGVDEERARLYEERVRGGKILVSVSTDDGTDVSSLLTDSGATEVETRIVRS